MDSASCEFAKRKLIAAQKLEIIIELGLDRLTEVLHECYVNKGVASYSSYNAKQDAAFFFILRKDAGEIDYQECSRLLRDIIMPPHLSELKEG